MARPIQLLVLDDRQSDALLMVNELKQAGFEVDWKRVETEADYLAALEQPPQVILSDYNMPQFDPIQALRLLRRRNLDIPLLIVSGSIGEDIAVAAMREGAADYLLKDRLGRLGEAVRHALEQAQLQREKKQADAALREHAALAVLNADVGLAFTKADKLRDMLQDCAESMVRNLYAPFARIWTFNEAAQMLELQASAGLYTHIDGPHSRVPIGAYKIGLIAQERKPHLTNDVQNDPRVSDRAWARREGMVAFAGYPLQIDQRLVGVMAVFARRPLTPATLAAMAAVADHLALGIERKQAEERLRQSNQNLQALIQASPLAIVAVDGKLNVLRWSPGAERIFGWSADEVIGRPIPFIPSDELPQARVMIEAELQGETRSALELRRLRKDGFLMDVCLWTAPLRDDNGHVIASLGVLADMTAQKKLEEQFRQAQKMEAVGRLAGGVAHDFNNLLTIIIGYSEVVQDRLRPEDPMRGLIEQINKAGNRAASLTRQLLAFSRKQILVPVVLNLNVIVTDMEKMLHRLIGEDIEFTVSQEPDLWMVKVDPGQIEQVVMNIVVNARDAMPQGGKLTIETRNRSIDDMYVATHPYAQRGDYVKLVISDTGCGMDKATQDRIFEPFFTTKGPEKGTGLGLATVYGIVKQSDGYIEVYSEVGHGTTFKIYLPRCEQAASARPSGTLAKPARGVETILLIEDDAGVRSFSRMILKDHGYTVLEAANGGEALLLCEQHQAPIHLVVSDVVMPNLSGPQVVERLKQLRPDLKVLYLSGYTDEAIVRHGILSADMPFLQKPFNQDVLTRKVREVLG